MIKETGKVVAVEPDCVWVETIRKSTCNSCSAQKGCGYGLLNETVGGQAHRFRVAVKSSEQTFSCGDVVRVSIPEAILVKGALLVYILPLVTMLLMLLVASSLGADDLWGFFAAGIGLVTGFVGVRWYSTYHQNNPDLQPSIETQCDPAIQCVQI